MNVIVEYHEVHLPRPVERQVFSRQDRLRRDLGTWRALVPTDGRTYTINLTATPVFAGPVVTASGAETRR